MKKVLFIDRDGVLIIEPPDEQIDSLEKLEFYPGVFSGLANIATNTDYELVMGKAPGKRLIVHLLTDVKMIAPALVDLAAADLTPMALSSVEVGMMVQATPDQVMVNRAMVAAGMKMLASTG